MPRTTGLLPLAAAVLGLAAAAPPSLAEPTAVHSYDVTVAGHGSWTHDGEGPPTGVGRAQLHEHAEWTWKTTQRAQFDGPQLRMLGAPETTATVLDAQGTMTVPTPGGVLTGGCRGDRWSHGVVLGTSFVPRPHPTWDDDQEVVVDGFDTGLVVLDECSGNDLVYPGSILSLEAVAGRANPYLTRILIAPWDRDDDTIERTLGGTAFGADCPNRREGLTTTCSLQWNAKVTFRRTGTATITDEPAEPAQGGPAPGGGAGAPSPGTPSTPTPGRGKVGIGKGRLGAGASTAEVRVNCGAGCRVSAEAVALQRARKGRPRRRARGAAAPLLSRATSTLEVGGSTTIRLRFDRSDRRAIRRAGGVALTVRVAPADGGAPVVRRMTLRT